MNRRLVVLLLVLVVSGIIAGGLVLLMSRLSKDPTADIAKAQDLMAKGEEDPAQYMTAIQFLKSALNSGAQGRPDVWAMLAECYQKQPQPNLGLAIESLRNAAERSPNDTSYLKSYADMLLQAGGLREALPQAQKLAQLEPQNSEHQRMIAQIQYGLARGEPGLLEKRRLFQEALAAADKAISLEPSVVDNYSLKISLLDVYSRLDPERSEEYYNQAADVARLAIEKCEDKVDATLRLAEIRRTQAAMYKRAAKPRESNAMLAEAEKAYRDALAIDAKSVAAMLGLGYIAMARAEDDKAESKKYYGQAEEHFRAAIEADPANDAGYLGMAGLKAELNEVDAATDFLRQAVAKGTPTAELTDRAQIAARARVLGVLADLLMEQTDPDSIAEARKRVADLEAMKAPEQAATVLYLQGRLAVIDGDMRRAQGLLQKAVEQKPDHPQYRRRLAQVYVSQNLSGKALQEYDEALRLAPTQYNVRLERAQLLLTLRQFDEAEKEARRVMQAGSYAAALILARAQAAQGKYNEALATANEMIRVAEKMPQGYMLKSQVLIAAGRPPTEGLKVLTDGLEKVDQRLPLYQEARLVCARYELTQEVEKVKQLIAADTSLTPEQKKALEAFDVPVEDVADELLKQMKEHPDDPDPVIKLALWRVRQNEIEEALTLYRKAYDLAVAAGDDKKVRMVWDNVWTLLLTQEGGREKAREWIGRLPESMATERGMAEALIKIMEAGAPNPEDLKGLTPEAQAKLRIDRLNEAIRMLKDLESRDELGTDVRIMRGMARAYYLLAMMSPKDRATSLAESEKYYRNAISLQPLDVQSQRSLLDVYVAMQDFTRVVTQANELLKVSPDDPVALDRMASARQAQGDRNEAVRLRRRLRTVQPKNTLNLYQLGQLLEQTGDGDSAEKTYREVLDIQPRQVDTSLALALLLIRRGESGRQEADKIMTDLLAAAQKDPATLRAVSRYYQNLRQFDKGVEYAKQAQAAVAKPQAGDVLFTVDAYRNLAVDPTRSDEEHRQALVDAAAVMQDFLKDHPEDLAVQTQLIDILRNTPGRAAEAETLARDVVKSAPKELAPRTLLARTLLDKALNAQLAGNETDFNRLLAEARQMTVDVLSEQGGYGEARLLRGEIEMAANDLSEAETQLRQVPRGDPAYLRSLLFLVRISQIKGNRQTMILTLIEILKIQPQNVGVRLQLVDLLAADGSYDRVEQLIREGLTYSPGNPQLMVALIRALVLQRNAIKAQEALKMAEQLVQILPDSPEAWATWALTMNTLGRADEATAKIEQLAEQHKGDEPRSAIAFGLLLSQQYVAAKQPDKARPVLEGLLSAHRKSPDVLSVYMELFKSIQVEGKAGWMSEAAPLLEQALTDFPPSIEHPQSLVVARTLVGIYVLQGKKEQARKIMVDVLKVAPRYTPMLSALGELELSEGHYDEAVRLFNEAIALDPGLWTARNNLAWIYSTSRIDLAKAREQIDEALRLQPRHPSLLDTSGWIYYLSKDYRSAERDLEAALKPPAAGQPQLTAGPIAKYHLGKALTESAARTDVATEAARRKARAKLMLEQFLAEDKDPAHAAERADAEKVLKDL